MRKIFLSLVCILTVCLLHAQSFGVISYTLPEGWIARQAGNDLELVKSKDETCKIILFRQTGTIVSTVKQFADLWAVKTKSANNTLQKSSIPVRTEGDGWISISASKTSGNSTEGFYTLCDSSITAILLTQIQGGACIKEVQSILASINIPVKESGTKTRAKSKKTKFPYVYR